MNAIELKTKKYYLKAAKIFTEQQVLTQHYLLIENGIITELTTTPQPNIKIVNLGELQLMPGMIDLHIHGREGCDVMDGELASIKTISKSLVKYGVIGFLGTTVTASWSKTLKAFQVLAQAYQEKMPGAQVLGAYNEGLFFSEAYKGAHNEKYFLPLTKERIDAIYKASNGTLKVMALAPEFDDSVAMIQYLRSLNVKVMLGHTCANYQQTLDALSAGACGGVHIFNAMSGIHHRDPGCAGAVLMDKNALAEVIADGIHLHPSIMQLIYQLKGQNKMALISDCISAGGFPDGTYQLGELAVKVQGGIAKTASGALAGSTLTLNKSVANIVEMTDISLLEAINMASLTPAKHLNIDGKLGSIALGKQASLAAFDHNLTVQLTIIDGEIVYCQQELADRLDFRLAKE